MPAKEKWTRNSIMQLEELSHVREALEINADRRAESGEKFDIWRPIRETPLSVFFDKAEHSFENMKLSPNLPKIWHSRYGIRIGDMAQDNPGGNLRETVNVPNSLSVLKIADEIIEGADMGS